MKPFKKILARLILFTITLGVFLVVNCRSDGDSNTWLIVSLVENSAFWITIFCGIWAVKNIDGGGNV